MSSDAVRRQAYRAASHGTDGAINYNPFARQRSREEALYDEENNIHMHSNNGQIDTTEEQRRNSGEETLPTIEEEGQPGTSTGKAATQPVSPKTDSDTVARPGSSVTGRLPRIDSKLPLGNDSTTANHEEISTTRRRSVLFLLPHHKARVIYTDNDDLSREERHKEWCKRKIRVTEQIIFLMSYHWILIGLLIFVPAGFALQYAHIHVVAVFCINFVAIVPSAAMLGIAVYQLSLRVGDNLAALLNMTFG